MLIPSKSILFSSFVGTVLGLLGFGSSVLVLKDHNFQEQPTRWTGRGLCKGCLVSNTQEITIELPSVIGINDSRRASARMLVKQPAKFKITLSSLAFDVLGIADTSSTNPTRPEWTWLIRPKSVGSHAVSVNIVSSNPDLYIVGDDLPNMTVSDQGRERIFFINVVNELGLTSAQDAWIKALGAIIGVLGTALSYPIFKRYFERKEQPTKPTPALPAKSSTRRSGSKPTGKV